MIYTLTLNPALDYIVRLNHLDLGETNYMSEEIIKVGGKGINASKLLANLGESSVVLGYIGGFTGEELRRKIIEDGLQSELITVSEGVTRINVKIKAQSETEINGQGLSISPDEVERLYTQLDRIQDGDYLFLSGSIPNSLGSDFYQKIMIHLSNRDIKITVDASGDALKHTLKCKPYLIKPNLRELEGIFDVTIKEDADLAHYTQLLQQLGAQNIIVSLGADGAYMRDSLGTEYRFNAPEGMLIDSVGAGDSMVAGFVYAMKQGFTTEEAFKFSMCCGSATAFSPDIARSEEIYELYERL